MPALPSPGPVVRCHLRFGPSDTNQWGSRFYLTYTGGPPSFSDIATFAGDVLAQAASDLVPNIGSSLFLTEAQVVDLSSDTGNEGIATGSHEGGMTGAPVPEDVSAIVNHEIGRRYRGGKPKIFLPPGDVTALADDKSWTTDYVGAVSEGWATFIAALLALSFGSFSLSNIVNVSYYHGFTVFTTPLGRARNIPTQRATPLVDDITSSSCRGEIGSQRRRRTAITG